MPREELIQIRGGTAAQWLAADPVLEVDEPGVETDTGKMKIGNGVSHWSQLPYVGGSVTGGLTAVIYDTTPALGGDLNVNGHKVGAATPADLTMLDTIHGLSGIVKVSGGTASAAVSGTDYVPPSGNVATATKLATPRNINGVAFDGSGDIAIPVPHATVVDIRDYIISGSTFNMTAVVAAMEQGNGSCYIPPGNWTPSSFNIPLDDAQSVNPATFTYHFFGEGYESILHLPAGMSSTDSLFVANSTANFSQFYAHPKIRINDFMVMGPSGTWTTYTGQFLTTNQKSISAARMYFGGIGNAIVGNGYMDVGHFEQIYTAQLNGGGYMYYGTSTGDGLTFDQCFTYGCNAIRLSACAGATIRNCVGGWYFISGSNVTLIGNHVEGDGNNTSQPVIQIRNSRVQVLSGLHQTNIYRPHFSINDVAGGEPSQIFFAKGVDFCQRLDDTTNVLGSAVHPDIDIVNLLTNSDITIEEARTRLWNQSVILGTGQDTQSYFTGLTVTASGVSGLQTALTAAGSPRISSGCKLSYDNSTWSVLPLGNSTVIPTEVIPQTYCVSVGPATQAVANVVPDPSLTAGTYYYRAFVTDSVGRMTVAAPEFSVTTTSGTPVPALRFSTGSVRASTLTFLRGTVSGTYTQSCSVTVTKSVQTFYDQGTYMAGQPWVTYSGTPALITNTALTQTRNGYMLRATGNSVIYGTAAPTVGSWIVGDCVINTTPTANGISSWMCISAGSPGTWVAQGGLGATFPASGLLVGTTDTQTLSGKTLTTPVINDANGNLNVGFSSVASAVNYIKIANAATGATPGFVAAGADPNVNIVLAPKGSAGTILYSGTAGVIPTIQASGVDTNVHLNLLTQAAGVVMANGVPVVTTTGTQTLSGKTLSAAKITGGLLDSNGAVCVGIGATASAVNYLQITNNVGGSSPSIAATGTDTNLSVYIQPKGTGALVIQQGTSGAAARVAAVGTDSAIAVNLQPKGTGQAQVNGNQILTWSNTTVTTTTTLAAVSGQQYIILLGAGAVVTLPTAVGNTSLYVLKNIDTASKTIATTSSQTIEGATTLTINAGDSFDVVSDGSNWRIV